MNHFDVGMFTFDLAAAKLLLQLLLALFLVIHGDMNVEASHNI